MNKTNWIDAYGDNKTRKYQAGGPMGPEAGMAPPPPEGGGGPDLEGMLMEYAETRDPQLAVAICDMLVEMMAGAQGGAPAGGPPPGGEEAAMAAPPPMGRKGMRMSKAPIF